MLPQDENLLPKSAIPTPNPPPVFKMIKLFSDFFPIAFAAGFAGVCAPIVPRLRVKIKQAMKDFITPANVRISYSEIAELL